MGIFDIFKSNQQKPLPKGAHELTISAVQKLTSDSVQISFEVPENLSTAFQFKAGQYIAVELEINGKKERRSYSICAGPNEPLAIGVKKLEGGLVSSALQNATNGQKITVFEPEGSFLLQDNYKKVVAIAAGSGITPIMSMLKAAKPDVSFQLLYGNKSPKNAMFLSEIVALPNANLIAFYSQEKVTDANEGRIDEESLKALIKADLTLLQADAYFLCGPQEMVKMAEATFSFFGVSPQKIHKELFFATAETTKTPDASFSGKSHVKIMLDGDIVEFDTNGDKSLLEQAEKAGLDAPFSCRGGVCSSCKAKVLKGSAKMRMNHALTDSEVAAGYILTCQAHPTSEQLIVSFDE